MRSPADTARALVEQLRQTRDRKALVALARLGPDAADVALDVAALIGDSPDAYWRAHAIDTLRSLCREGPPAIAGAVALYLAAALEHRAFRGMRHKIVHVLIELGLAARPAIPTLARTLRRHDFGASLHSVITSALVSLAWCCWQAQHAADQEFVFESLAPLTRSYQVWLLQSLLSEPGGAANRARADEMLARLQT